MAFQNLCSPTSLVNGRIASVTTVTKPTRKRNHWRPRRSPRPEPISGASVHGANLAAPASASRAPRTTGERMKTSAQTTNAAVSVSFEFDSSTNELYGKAAHAKASAMPSSLPAWPSRSRVPSMYIPHVVSRSNVIAAACAAGRSSQTPLQPNTARDGTYA